MNPIADPKIRISANKKDYFCIVFLLLKVVHFDKDFKEAESTV